MQLGFVSAIEIQTWNFVRHFNMHFYECPPIELYLKHFAPIFAANPFQIPIIWDTGFRPSTVEEWELVSEWRYHNVYDDRDWLIDYYYRPRHTGSTSAAPIDVPEYDGWGPNTNGEESQGWGDMDMEWS